MRSINIPGAGSAYGIILVGESMDDRITIIEGPPPLFEEISEGWVLGLNESPNAFDMALTRLRTYNGPALVERCHRMWSRKEPIYLHYRDEMGLEKKVSILAARASEVEEGQVLYLWIKRNAEAPEAE